MSTFGTVREIPATLAEVYAAISDPARLARWWGPAGFTNTSNVCEFKKGGRWSLVMHGPDGTDFPNEYRFAEVDASGKIVVDHVVEPKFRLSIVLTESATGTRVAWTQMFENADVARRIESIVVPANEQNLDRLSAEVLKK